MNSFTGDSGWRDEARDEEEEEDKLRPAAHHVVKRAVGKSIAAEDEGQFDDDVEEDVMTRSARVDDVRARDRSPVKTHQNEEVADRPQQTAEDDKCQVLK